MAKDLHPTADDVDERAVGSAHRLSWEQALAWRMGRHRLMGRAAPADLVRVVGAIGGLHAQLMSSAELSLWTRIDGLEREAVQAALWQRRALVKLWVMRGTLYLLPSAELGVWLAALGTQTKYGNTGHPELDVLAAAVGRALEGRVLTREELARAVEQITGPSLFGERVRFSWGSYLKAVSFRDRSASPGARAATSGHPERPRHGKPKLSNYTRGQVLLALEAFAKQTPRTPPATLALAEQSGSRTGARGGASLAYNQGERFRLSCLRGNSATASGSGYRASQVVPPASISPM